MKNLKSLSRNALRAVIGGFGSTCSTTCSNGKTLKLHALRGVLVSMENMLDVMVEVPGKQIFVLKQTKKIKKRKQIKILTIRKDRFSLLF